MVVTITDHQHTGADMRAGKKDVSDATPIPHFEPRQALSTAAITIATEFEFKGICNQPGQFQGSPVLTGITPDLARDVTDIFEAIDAMSPSTQHA
jgi:hypothetical protein